MLEGVAYSIIKSTFFQHFCAGENIEEAKTSIDKLGKEGVSSIIDFCNEVRCVLPALLTLG